MNEFSFIILIAVAMFIINRVWKQVAVNSNKKRTKTALVPPKIIHKILSKDEVKSRIVIVGDPHGCLDELKLLLKKCNYDAMNTSLFIVGDLVNKGPYSAEVVKFCREIGALCVRGNHDEAALENIGVSKPKAHYDYLNKLTKYYIYR